MATSAALMKGEIPLPTTEIGNETEDAKQETTQPHAPTISDEQYRAMQDVLNYVYDYRSPEGHDPSKLFHKRVNKRYVPDYYEVIKEPQAMSNIKQKLSAKNYATFQEFVRDWALICHNAQVYNRPESGAYQDALTVKALVEAELKKMIDAGLTTAEMAAFPYLGEIPHVDDVPPDEGAEEVESSDSESEEEGEKKRGRGRPRKHEKEEGEPGADMDARKKRGRPPRVDTPTEARIKNILKAMRRPKNAAGEYKILPFDRLPDKLTMPGYYMEVQNPMAVDIIKRKFKRKKYISVEQFMQDVDLMFENAKRFNEDDSQIYKDAVDLQKEARRLVTEEMAKPDSEFAMEDGRIPLPNGIPHNGDIYKAGDWVHIQNANDLTKPIVTQIYRTWQNISGQKFVNVCWYYRPEQTVHRFDKHFYENEVVKTGQYRDHSIEEVINRCFVMFITRWHKGRPRGYPNNKEIYVCESRYNEEKLTFNKIKTWASCLPDEVRDKDYEMELYAEPKKMKKLPSPIAYLLKDDAKETDELPKPEWGADNAPPKIGAVHKRPRDARDSPPPLPTPSPPPPPVQPQPQPARQMSTTISQPLQQFRASAFSNSTPARQTPTTSTPQPLQSLQPPTQNLSHNSVSPIPRGTSTRPTIAARGPSYNTTAQTPQSSYTSSLANTNLNTTTSFSNNPNTTNLNNNNRYSTNTASSALASTIPAYTPYTSGITNYKAPQPIEVWSLNDAANASIPPDIRHQFRCDEAGRVLFFTAPPVEFAEQDATINVSEQATLLGHSIAYTANKIRRKAELEERKKRMAEQQLERAEKRQRLQEEQAKEFEAKAHVVSQKALKAWETQLRTMPEMHG